MIVVSVSTTYLAHKSMLELNICCTDESQIATMAGRDILSLTVRSKSDCADHPRPKGLAPRLLRTGNLEQVLISLFKQLASLLSPLTVQHSSDLKISTCLLCQIKLGLISISIIPNSQAVRKSARDVAALPTSSVDDVIDASSRSHAVGPCSVSLSPSHYGQIL